MPRLSSYPDQPRADPLPIYADAVEMARPAPRMYIIGHPGGRDIEFSLQDNQLVGCSDKLLHYRTPTEPGSSGSPVFEMQSWQVVGLHHAHVENVPRVKGVPGAPYSANEAISILALQKHSHSGGHVSKPKHSTPQSASLAGDPTGLMTSSQRSIIHYRGGRNDIAAATKWDWHDRSSRRNRRADRLCFSRLRAGD